MSRSTANNLYALPADAIRQKQFIAGGTKITITQDPTNHYEPLKNMVTLEREGRRAYYHLDAEDIDLDSLSPDSFKIEDGVPTFNNRGLRKKMNLFSQGERPLAEAEYEYSTAVAMARALIEREFKTAEGSYEVPRFLVQAAQMPIPDSETYEAPLLGQEALYNGAKMLAERIAKTKEEKQSYERRALLSKYLKGGAKSDLVQYTMSCVDSGKLDFSEDPIKAKSSILMIAINDVNSIEGAETSKGIKNLGADLNGVLSKTFGAVEKIAQDASSNDAVKVARSIANLESKKGEQGRSFQMAVRKVISVFNDIHGVTHENKSGVVKAAVGAIEAISNALDIDQATAQGIYSEASKTEKTPAQMAAEKSTIKVNKGKNMMFASESRAARNEYTDTINGIMSKLPDILQKNPVGQGSSVNIKSNGGVNNVSIAKTGNGQYHVRDGKNSLLVKRNGSHLPFESVQHFGDMQELGSKVQSIHLEVLNSAIRDEGYDSPGQERKGATVGMPNVDRSSQSNGGRVQQILRGRPPAQQERGAVERFAPDGPKGAQGNWRGSVKEAAAKVAERDNGRQ